MCSKNVNEYIDPWVTCPVCCHPIRGEHQTFKLKWGVFAKYEIVIHEDCRAELVDRINGVGRE